MQVWQRQHNVSTQCVVEAAIRGLDLFLTRSRVGYGTTALKFPSMVAAVAALSATGSPPPASAKTGLRHRGAAVGAPPHDSVSAIALDGDPGDSRPMFVSNDDGGPSDDARGVTRRTTAYTTGRAAHLALRVALFVFTWVRLAKSCR